MYKNVHFGERWVRYVWVSRNLQLFSSYFCICNSNCVQLVATVATYFRAKKPTVASILVNALDESVIVVSLIDHYKASNYILHL